MDQPDRRRLPAPILCVNANPSVERTCIVDQFAIGEVNRTSRVLVTPSGKAATVARVIARLGFDALQVGPVAGEVGRSFVRLAEAEGLVGDWLWVDGETRTNVTIVPTDGGPDTILNEAGPELSPGDWSALSEKLLSHCRAGTPVCISGSMPAGVGPDDLTRLVTSLRESGAPVFIDSNGWALQGLLAGRPWCAKINHHEASVILGRPIDDVSAAAAAAGELLSSVEKIVIITMGAEGAVVATAGSGIAHVTAPPVRTVSGVGSGDTFLGALVAALFGQQRDVLDAVRFAAAAGALNAATTTQGQVDADAVEAAAEQGTVRMLGGGEGR